MDIRNTEPGIHSAATSLDDAPPEITPAVAAGLPHGVSEALADPIVMALMAADRVDRNGFEDLLQRIAASLSRRHPQDKSASPQDKSASPQDKSASLIRGEKPDAGSSLGKLAKGLALAFMVIASVSGPPRPAAADEAPVAFIRTLGTQAVSVIRSPMPLFEKAAYFDQMVRQDFDLSGICRFVLGPYWRVSNPAERQQFCDGFADRMVRFYGRRLAQAGDGDFVVTGSRAATDGVIVTSRINPPQGAPIAVDWRLGVSDGHYKIEDVAIDGVSMVLTERSEIAEQIARDGGQVEMLLAAMRG